MKYIKNKIYKGTESSSCEFVVRGVGQTTFTIDARIDYCFIAPFKKYIFWYRFKRLMGLLRERAVGFDDLANASLFWKTETFDSPIYIFLLLIISY